MGYTFTFFVGVILVDYKSTKNYTKNTFTLIPAMILYQLNKHLKTPDIEVTFSGLITIGKFDC